MECRDARPLIARLNVLAAPERERLDGHLRACPACHDEADEPISALWNGLPFAIPPPDLAEKVVRRLPSASPLALAARRARTTRIVRGIASGGLGLAVACALVGIGVLQSGPAHAAGIVQGLGLPIVLTAKALLIALAQPWLAVLLTVVALLVAVLLPRMADDGKAGSGRVTRPLLASGALLAALLLANAGARGGDLGAISASLDVDRPVSGDVTSLAGDITVRGDVQGDVVALAGHVALEDGAHVYGSVMSGAGAVGRDGAQVDQEVIDLPGVLPVLAQATGTQTTATIASTTVVKISGMLVTVATLLLGILLAAVWPHALAEGSTGLARFPFQALVLGGLATAGLLVLAFGGTILLAATVAGVLLVPVLLALLHLPSIAGVATMGYALGQRLTGRPTAGSTVWGIAAQLVVVTALGLLVPAVGLSIFYLLGAAGLGGILLSGQWSMISDQ